MAIETRAIELGRSGSFSTFVDVSKTNPYDQSMKQKQFFILLFLPFLFALAFVAQADTGNLQMSPELSSCLKKAIGEARFNEITSGASQPTAEEQSKGSGCFSGIAKPSAPPTQPSTTNFQPLTTNDKPVVQVDPALEACMQQALGESRFQAIKSGQQPTDQEMQAGRSCFEKIGKVPPAVMVKEQMPPSVVQCLQLAVGKDRFEAISSGASAPTLAERQAGEKCFGASPGPISEGVRPKIDEGLAQCLKAAVGEARFSAISQGEAAPTLDEKSKGEACFQKHKPNMPKTAETILPPPPEEVPYLPEEPGTIAIESVQTKVSTSVTDDRVKGETTAVAITLAGRGQPNTVVDIHIFSEPETVSTQADSSGQWEYIVDRDIAAGTHRIYATTRTGTRTVRSEDQTFVVETSTTSSTPISPATTAPVDTGSTTSGNQFFLISGLVFLILLIASIIWMRKGAPKR